MLKTVTTTMLALLACSNVSAQTTHKSVRTIEVSHSDLDLSTQSGQDKLKQRVLRAVRNVCAFPAAKTAAEHSDQQKCRARAKTTAMREAGETIARFGSSVKVALD
ncbi:UrcA family protein [Sphingorhabdus sp.]|uniref:UrcA family protein n=1 Tax=Sphingorhabdus sp. TaxID=1902408 RepID=UPI0032B8766A